MPYARRPIGMGGVAGQTSAAESGRMQPICGSAGKDVFCGINPGGLAGMQGSSKPIKPTKAAG